MKSSHTSAKNTHYKIKAFLLIKIEQGRFIYLYIGIGKHPRFNSHI